MTEEYRNELRGVVNDVFENSFTRLYEENKKYVRVYERLVLETMKIFNFYNEDFNEELLKEKTDLVGKTNYMYLIFDKKAKKGKIHLSYCADSRLPEYKESKKPEYLEQGTFNKEYMDFLLAEQGIKVKYTHGDGCISSDDTYTIEFDASLLVEALAKVDTKTKRRVK